MKILLTGANGQVGRAIVEASAHYPVTLITCDRRTCDITNATAVSESIARHRPDVVINAAAYTAVDKAEAERDLAFLVNAAGAKNLAQACANADIPLLHLSTDYIFDGQNTAPYLETDTAAPIGVYGASKWQGEQAIRDRLDKYIILRVSWVFGEHGHNFVKTMLRLMQEREELRVVADQRGCPTYASDIAHTLLKIAFTKHWGTFHYCGSPATTWYDFACVIAQAAANAGNLKVKHIQAITTAEYPTPARRPANSVLNCQKFMDTFAMPPGNWQAGLTIMLQQFAAGEITYG